MKWFLLRMYVHAAGENLERKMSKERMKHKAKIKKYIEFFTTKLHLLFEQKIFRYGEVNLKYIWKRKNSKNLIIVFSSCTRQGIKARYNYMRSLKDVQANQLFILDDFSEDKRGSYYVGNNYTFCEEKATKALIERIIRECKPVMLVFCGSSKGGYAALDFGLQFENAYIVAGGPQYLLADYLGAGSEERLRYILGDITEEKKIVLNNYLRNRIKNNPYGKSQHIYLHYSDKEHTYTEHVQYLLNDLKEKEYDLKEDIADYADHSDIAFYFPTFMLDSLTEILGNDPN